MFDSLRQDITGAIRGLHQEPGLRRRRAHHAGAGHRRHLSHLQRRQGGADHAAAVCGARTRVQMFTRWIGFDKTWLADQEVVDFRNMSKTMTAIAAWSSGQQNLTGDGEPVRIGVGFVTAKRSTCSACGPLLGRVITAEEDVPNGAPVAVLGYPLWQSRYGGDPSVIGRTIDDQRRAGRGDRRDAGRLPAADRLHRRSGGADAAVAAAALGHDAASVAITATSAPRCSRRGRRPPPRPRNCSAISRRLTEQGAVSGGDAVLGVRRRRSTKRSAAASGRRCGC